MSRFSGKCDLFDHIMMLKHRTKDGSDKKEDLEQTRVLYSDELECFNIFKARTQGVIYQHKCFTVTPWNHEDAVKLCPELEIIEHKRIVSDKRQKSGQREDVYYTYKYWGKEYTLKELNKHKVYITIAIHFNTLLDLIPYYPYIVCINVCNDGKETVCISSQSFVDEELDGHLEHGWYSDYWQHYKKELQNHYIDVCKKYFLYNLEDRTHIVPITNLTKNEDGNYYMITDTDIDYMHEIEFVWEDNKLHSHWTSPKLSGLNTIVLSKEDVETYLRQDIDSNNVKIRYVESIDFPLHLG